MQILGPWNGIVNHLSNFFYAGAPFHDLDFVIENEAGMSINDIFKTKGEAAFRAMESRLLPDLLQPGAVVALGGGAPIHEENWKIIVERSTTVFIDCGFETIWERIKDTTNRPLLASKSRAELEAMRNAPSTCPTWSIRPPATKAWYI